MRKAKAFGQHCEIRYTSMKSPSVLAGIIYFLIDFSKNNHIMNTTINDAASGGIDEQHYDPGGDNNDGADYSSNYFCNDVCPDSA